MHPTEHCRVHLGSLEWDPQMHPFLFCLFVAISTPSSVRIDVTNDASCSSASRQRDLPNGRSICHFVQPPQRKNCVAFYRKSREPLIIRVHKDRANLGGLAIVVNSVERFPHPAALRSTCRHERLHPSVCPLFHLIEAVPTGRI